METRLIMLPQPILVSDETAIDGDLVLYSSYNPLRLKNNNLYSLGGDWACLPNQNSEFQPYRKIIAGIEGLPKLNPSLIAGKIGWVDVEAELKKVYKEYAKDVNEFNVEEYINSAERFGVLELHKMIFKAAQSLSEKKYSEGDMINAFYAGQQRHDLFEADDYLKTLKPKEYLVEVEMEYYYMSSTKFYSNEATWVKCSKDNFEGIKKVINSCPLKIEPKITNNTIKILKIAK